MLTMSWLKGILFHRPGRLAGSLLGIALTVALLALLGTFMSSSAATMTKRALKDVPVDWQVELVPGADFKSVKAALSKATSTTAVQEVGYADAAGFSTITGETTQVTGPGKVLGVSDGYRDAFPAEARQLLGSRQGALLAQQTAANLHATVGDTITINRVGLPPATVRVDGVVDLPNADSLFQAVGVPPGAAPRRRPTTCSYFRAMPGTSCSTRKPLFGPIPFAHSCT